MGNLLLLVICVIICISSLGCQTKVPAFSDKLSPIAHHLGINGQILENFYVQGLFISSDSGLIRFFETNINGKTIQESAKISYPGNLIDWNLDCFSNGNDFGWLISKDKDQKFLTGIRIELNNKKRLVWAKVEFTVKTEAQKAGFYLDPTQPYFAPVIVCENETLDKIYYYNKFGKMVFSYSTKPLLLGKGYYCYDGNVIYKTIRMENDPKKPYNAYQPIYLEHFSSDVANYNPADCVILANSVLFCKDGAYFYTRAGEINLGVREEFVDELPDSNFILIKGSLRYGFYNYEEITAGFKLVEAQINDGTIKLLANDSPNLYSEVCYYCTITPGGDTLNLKAAISNEADNEIKKFSLGMLKDPQLFLAFNGGMLIDSDNTYKVDLSDVESYVKSIVFSFEKLERNLNKDE